MSPMKLTLASLLATSLVLGVAGFACGRTADASPGGSSQHSGPGKSSDSKANTWKAEAKVVGTYAAGKEGSFEVVVTALGDFHINDDYPAKFKTGTAPADVTYRLTTISRKDNKDQFTGDACAKDKEHACALHVKVPFTAAKAGKYKVGGTFNVGVCSAANCIMEKIDLELDVDVK